MPARKRYQEDPSKGQDDNADSDPLGVGDIGSYTPPQANIGVPDDYTATVDISSYSDIFGTPGAAGTRGRPGTVERRPMYQDGDELLPANYSPDQIAELQKSLAQVGLLPANARLSYRVWDETSQAAFYKLLAYANQNGLHWTTALDKLKGQMQEGGGGFYEVDENGNLVPVDPNAPEKLPTHTTPTEELLPVFRAAVIDTLGEGWSDEQLQDMAAAYQAQQIQRQREAYAAEGTTKNVQEMMSPEAFATARAEAADPDRAAAEKGLAAGQEFQDLLGGWQNAGMGTL